MSDQDNTARRASELIDRWRSAHGERPDWGEAIAKTEEALTEWRHPHGQGPITVTYSTPHLTAYALTQWLARSIGQLDAPGRRVEVWGGPTPRLDDPGDPEGHDDAVLTLRVDTSDGHVDLLLIEVHSKVAGAPAAGAFTLSVTPPDGTAIIAPMVPTESTGVYSATYTTTMAGLHVVRLVDDALHALAPEANIRHEE